MSLTNHDRITKAMDLLRQGLGPFVEREFQNLYGDKALGEAFRIAGGDRNLAGKSIPEWDALALVKLMWDSWKDVFRRTLGQAERTLVSELWEARNRWAHQQTFTSDDAYRTLDSAARLLTAVSATEAAEVEKMKTELLRLRFDEQTRAQKRKSAENPIEGQASSTLKPWREVATPHRDVASGRYQQAEFAADLWQVHMGEGTDEYRDPAEFFRRTYLTESLKRLLVGGVERLSGKGGDPVVQLQTNFGGGKTHSMLALYHLFSGIAPGELAGVDALLAEAGVTSLPKARRVVLVGNKISPGNPVTKPDGTVVRTLWGELAWQLGFQAGGAKEAKKAFARIAADDEKATSPGDALRELMNDYGPSLVLIDEWVAYARQLHDQSDLPAGTFETQFTFAQALTEAARAAKNTLLVISLPASDTGHSPHAQADDVEVGGLRGRDALDRLKNVVGRVESSWRPASAEEGFEIVRRRLFEPLVEPEKFQARDLVARAFFDLYRTQHQEFPPECRTADYERRLKAAYPIHPEIFDRLYTDWSTLVKFQRTRGVLRLMAAVIHSLWEKGDRNPLILPSMIPIDDPRVLFELTRYLSDNWTPVIERDVDGPSSLPLRLDGEIPNLGKLAACRRVARTIYLGSAPTATAAHRGIEDRRVKLGCVMPGESPAVFGDALRRLAGTATFLYQDGPRFWYSTQPTVTKLAEDRAEMLNRDSDKVAQEIDKRVRVDLRKCGDFCRIHAMPRSGADVPDDLDTRLVVLGVDYPYSKESAGSPGSATTATADGSPECPARGQAKAILESRGNAPRLYRNTLVFLAVDKMRLQDLDEAARRYLAWESIVAEKETLNLDPHQSKQAETQKASADGVVTARIPEAYQWLLVPAQANPTAPIEWQAVRLTGLDPLAVRASKRLKNDEALITSFAPTRLRMELDRVPLWRGDHVSIKQLVEDFARYLYLPRLAEPSVLIGAIQGGPALLTWAQDAFAYAESFDETAGRYRGLQGGKLVTLSGPDSPGLVVKAEVAKRQLEAEAVPPPPGPGPIPPGPGPGPTPPSPPAPAPKVRRFHGNVDLDPTRVGRDAGRIAEEVIAHVVSLPGAEVKVTLEIEATIPEGAPEHVVRTVTENSRTLKFGSAGFETE
jgi:predicted AAA+ superfamily ATPase